MVSLLCCNLCDKCSVKIMVLLYYVVARSYQTEVFNQMFTLLADVVGMVGLVCIVAVVGMVGFCGPCGFLGA